MDARHNVSCFEFPAFQLVPDKISCNAVLFDMAATACGQCVYTHSWALQDKYSRTIHSPRLQVASTSCDRINKTEGRLQS